MLSSVNTVLSTAHTHLSLFVLPCRICRRIFSYPCGNRKLLPVYTNTNHSGYTHTSLRGNMWFIVVQIIDNSSGLNESESETRGSQSAWSQSLYDSMFGSVRVGSLNLNHTSSGREQHPRAAGVKRVSCEVLSNQAMDLFTSVHLRRVNGCFFLLCKSCGFCFSACLPLSQIERSSP